MFGGGPEDMQSGTMMPLGPDAPPVPLPGSPGSMGAPPPSHIGTPMRPSPPGQHPSHAFPMPPPVPSGLPPNFHGNRPNINPSMKLQRPPFPPMPDLQMLQNRTFHAMGQNPVEFLNSFFRNQTIGQGGWYLVNAWIFLKQLMTAISSTRSEANYMICECNLLPDFFSFY